MALSRDRLVRPVDIAVLFEQRRVGPLGILVDDADVNSVFGSPVQRRPAAAIERGGVGALGTMGRGGVGLRTPRLGNDRSLQSVYRTPAGVRLENTPPGGRVSRRRGRNSVLPSWYPRTPLRDITTIMRAIERRRSRLGDAEGLGSDSVVTPRGDRATDPSESFIGAPLKHTFSIVTPAGKAYGLLSAEKMSKTLLKIADESADDSEFLTPQKKLLNSIEVVEKVVMEDLQKLKRTPGAKRAEREKKVRTLMSMR